MQPSDPPVVVPRAPRADPAPARVSQSSFAGLSILVAEDEPTNRLVTRAMLGRLGCAVDFAEDGAQAVAKAKCGAYDLIIMDCMMPGQDGFSATREIRAWQADQRRYTPIVAFTALTEPGDRDRCLSAGMDDYMTKPARTERFREVLEQWALPHH